MVSIASGSLIDIVVSSFLSFLRWNRKRVLTLQLLHFSYSLDGFGHLLVPSEIFTLRGKKILDFLLVPMEHANRTDAPDAKRSVKNPGDDFSHKIEIPGYLTNVLLSVSQELKMTL